TGVKTFAIAGFEGKDISGFMLVRFQERKLIYGSVFVKKMLMEKFFVNAHEICAFSLKQTLFQPAQVFLGFGIHQTTHAAFYRISEDFFSLQISNMLSFGGGKLPGRYRLFTEDYLCICHTIAPL